MFYSVQGEGYFTGTPAIFIRFSGCNLKCPFCDTKHQYFWEVTEEEIVTFASKHPAELVVITGGEPSLQLKFSLVRKLHEIDKFVAVETNGTNPLPENVDWVTVSPKLPYIKQQCELAIKTANELKVVFDTRTPIEDPTFGIAAEHYFVQPCDTYNEKQNKENIRYCVEFVKQNPNWSISLQTQKILNVR